jgi:hypothetical protein
MTIPKAQRDDIEIGYETFGGPPGDPLLLVMGVGAQMLYWHDEFCARSPSAGSAWPGSTPRRRAVHAPLVGRRAQPAEDAPGASRGGGIPPRGHGG